MATKQAKKIERKPSPVNGQVLPAGFEAHPERRNNGAWKKSDTARYKFEIIMKMNDLELKKVEVDKEKSRFERTAAKVLLKTGDATNLAEANVALAMLERIINQVYGQPKQTIEQTNVDPPKPLSPRKQKTEQNEAKGGK